MVASRCSSPRRSGTSTGPTRHGSRRAAARTRAPTTSSCPGMYDHTSSCVISHLRLAARCSPTPLLCDFFPFFPLGLVVPSRPTRLNLTDVMRLLLAAHPKRILCLCRVVLCDWLLGNLSIAPFFPFLGAAYVSISLFISTKYLMLDPST
jgi:hypothetical protein